MNVNDMLALSGVEKEIVENLVDSLAALSDPSSLIDASTVAELTTTMEASEPGSMEFVAARLALTKINEVDVSSVEQDAVTALKRVLKSIPLSTQDCLDMGVPRSVLSAAAGGPGGSAPSAPKQRASRVSSDEVEKAILAQTGTFRISDVQSGASTATESKVLKSLVDRNHVETAGADSEHSRRGRAPMLYRVVSK